MRLVLSLTILVLVSLTPKPGKENFKRENYKPIFLKKLDTKKASQNIGEWNSAKYRKIYIMAKETLTLEMQAGPIFEN